ncbi:hypothetical protein B0H19DRAFT_1249672 [Mycena capillaripes]|nr:hypothetical protein B0H19DRAFT_1249672 [Mycena capillaripes]
MSHSSNAITLLPMEKQLNDQNWPVFKDDFISVARGRGYEGYDLRDANIGATLFQSVKDPKAHGLSATDMAHQMWIVLNAKFNRSSEVLKGLAFERLRSAKLATGRDMPAHLDELARLHAEVSCVGGRITDPEMNSIIFQSLPAIEFAGSILNLQQFSIIFKLTNELRTYWDLVHKKEVEVTGNGVANALAMNISGGLVCDNCAVHGHTKDACWARGGGREGQGRRWWRAPQGKEPRQSFVDAAKAARAAKAIAAAALASTPTMSAPQAVVAGPPPPPAPSTLTTAAFRSPMPTYALATWHNRYSHAQTLDGASTFDFSSVTDDNVLSRCGECGGSSPSLLNEHISRTEPDVVDAPSIYATNTRHESSRILTYLDSAASDPCVASCAQFVSYQKVEITGHTALESGGGFQVEGRGVAEFTVKIGDRSVHKILVPNALYTPGFAMNLISLPALDTRGFRSEWGNGRLSVVSREGKVDVVDNIDGYDFVAVWKCQ